MNTLKKQYLFHSSQLNLNKKDTNMSKGFSLVEIMVVIAILAVMVAVLVPSFLSYVENSRAQKDASATGELTNAVRLALADSDIYDEVCTFSTKGNISCYIDKEVESGYEKYKVAVEGPKKSYSFSDYARINDEIPYYGAGDMTGVTLTFTPSVNQSSAKMQYQLKNGVINKFVGSLHTMGDKLPKLTNRTISILSEKMDQTSNTYRNSDFTVFIKLNSIGGQKENTASVYGQYNGTNLNEPVKDIFLAGDRNASGTPTPNPGGGTQKPDGGSGGSGGGMKPDGGGGGSVTTPDPDKPGSGTTTPNPEQPNGTQKPHADDSTKMSLPKFRDNCINLTGTITFSLEKAPASGGIDISEAGNGSVIALISGQDATIYGKNGGGVHCPDAIGNVGLFEKFKVIALNLDGLDTSQVTNMLRMFSYCEKLQSLDLSSFDTSQVTNMGFVFSGCQNLQSLDVSSFNTSQVTDMGYMFSGCQNLQSLDVSSFDTSQTTDMGWMFFGCQNLQILDVSNFNTSQVVDMEAMFYNCQNLQSLDVSNFNTSQVTDMHHMFRNCQNLQSLNLNNFNTSQVTDMYAMFSNCNAFQTLDLSNFDTSKVTDIRLIFEQCNNLNIVTCRTQSDTDKMKTALETPPTINFIVKQ